MEGVYCVYSLKNFLELPKFFRRANREHAGNVEAIMDVAVGEVARCFGHESAFVHSEAVGEVELEDVAASFDVDAERERVADLIVRITNQFGLIQKGDIIHIQADSFADFGSRAKTHGEQVIVVGRSGDRVEVDESWGDLGTEAGAEFASDDDLVPVREAVGEGVLLVIKGREEFRPVGADAHACDIDDRNW